MRWAVSQSTLDRMISDGEFPAPAPLSRRRVGWPESTLTEWLARRNQTSLSAGSPDPSQSAEGGVPMVLQERFADLDREQSIAVVRWLFPALRRELDSSFSDDYDEIMKTALAALGEN